MVNGSTNEWLPLVTIGYHWLPLSFFVMLGCESRTRRIILNYARTRTRTRTQLVQFRFIRTSTLATSANAFKIKSKFWLLQKNIDMF